MQMGITYKIPAKSNVGASTPSHCPGTRGSDLKLRNFARGEDSRLFPGVQKWFSSKEFPRNSFGEGWEQDLSRWVVLVLCGEAVWMKESVMLLTDKIEIYT